MAIALALVAGTWACGDAEGPSGDPAEIELLDGDEQHGAAGAALAAPLRVLVTDADGAPLQGIDVEWDVVTGTGSIPPSSTTAADGVASATFTLGPELGEQRARAVLDGVAGSPVTFTATATEGGNGGIQLVSVVPVPQTAPFVHDTYVRDGLVFVFAWDEGVKIYDVGNGVAGGTAALPKLVGSVVTGTANGGSVSPSVHNGWWFHNPVSSEKRYLFVGQEGPGSVGSSSSGDIHVVDVSNLAAPVEVAFYHHPVDPDGEPVGVHNFWMDEPNEILYAAFYNGGVVALDVSGTLSGDLANRVISSVRPGGSGNTFVWGVQLAPNGSLYAIDMLSGLHQLQLQGNTLVAVGGGSNVEDRFSSDLWVHGNHAYTGTWGTRGAGQVGNVVKIWSLATGGAPALVNSLTIENVGTVSDVQVSANGAWLAVTTEYGSGAGLYLYDLSNPASPSFLDRYLVASPSGGLHTGTIGEVNGRQLVFAARDPSPGGPAMMIFDVTDVVP
jgi:hypothetical protein